MNYEKSYLDIVERVLRNPMQPDRTDHGMRCGFVESLFVPLRNGDTKLIPLLTTKKVLYDKVVSELIWFLRGETNVEYLHKYNNHIWDANTAETNGELGPGYGYQWRNFNNQGVDQISYIIEEIKRNPYSRRLLVSAWNPAQINEVSLPPCFLPGTLTLTERGYIPIEDVTEDDRLMSHAGNFRKIIQRHVTPYSGEIYQIKARFHPHFIKSTPEHPYYVLLTSESEPEWIKASEIKIGQYVGLPINADSILPEMKFPCKGPRGRIVFKSVDMTDKEVWFLMGYYVGDGWLDWNGVNKHGNSKNRFYFVFNKNDMETVYPRIQKLVKLDRKLGVKDTGCQTYAARKAEYWNMLKNFGHLAHGKRIPEWVQSAPKEYIETFLEGYNAADGCKTHDDIGCIVNATTVSPHLAFGLQRLYAKLGILTTVTYQHRPATHVIEGRVVNQRGTYHVKKYGQNYTMDCFIKNNYAWYPVIEIFKINVENTNVYNFDVDTDHTYVVENIAVHNCHFSFQFQVVGEVTGFGDEHRLVMDPKPKYLNCAVNMRSADILLGVPFNIASYATLTHLVATACGLQANMLHLNMTNPHIYEESTHIDAAKIILDRKPMAIPSLELSDRAQAVRTVEDMMALEPQDFVVKNYQHHPFIKINMIK